jgi:hypothetical protein
MSDPVCRSVRSSGWGIGRIVSLGGALGLCVSFFLPQIVYNVVYRTGGEELKSYAPAELVGVGTILCGLGLPFFAGVSLVPLLAFRAMSRVGAGGRTRTVLAWGQYAICLCVLITALGWLAYAFVPVGLGSSYASPIAYALASVGVGALAMGLAALVRGSLPRKAATAQFGLWAYYLFYFIYTATTMDVVLPGMWLSIAASGTLVVGSGIDWFESRPPAR